MTTLMAIVPIVAANPPGANYPAGAGCTESGGSRRASTLEQAARVYYHPSRTPPVAPIQLDGPSRKMRSYSGSTHRPTRRPQG